MTQFSPIIPEGLALIFDMDGVIIDSNPVHARAWRQYMEGFGIKIDNIEARMSGRRNDEIVVDFFGNSMDLEQVILHGAAKERLYREMMRPEIAARLVPGVVDFLRNTRGTPAGLATNAEPDNVDFVLCAAGLEGCFQAVVDGHQVERPKPHPEIYLRAAELVGFDPRNCIVFEDSFAGVAAARAAGARLVGVTTTHSWFPDADLTIRDFRDTELLQWLSTQRRFDE